MYSLPYELTSLLTGGKVTATGRYFEVTVLNHNCIIELADQP